MFADHPLVCATKQKAVTESQELVHPINSNLMAKNVVTRYIFIDFIKFVCVQGQNLNFVLKTIALLM